MGDEFCKDSMFILEDGDLSEDDFRAYLERRSFERAIVFLGDFANPEWS